MQYMDVNTASQKWGITGRRVRILCNDGRIDGAVRNGWFQLAFHGTTTKGITKLSTKFVGKNAAFHGWGLYFGSKKLASTYAKVSDYENTYTIQSKAGILQLEDNGSDITLFDIGFKIKSKVINH